MAKRKVSACKLIVMLISLQSMIRVFANSQSSEEHAREVHCSRERSRVAYKIIEEYLIPFVERESYQMSHKCKLHPGNDIFREQEEHKIHVDVNEWRCGYCKKSFRAEKFLDQHFDNRHYNLLNVSHNNCLADLCGALHCDHVANSVVPKTKCNPAAAARNRHLCESLADSCFPIHQGPSASRLHELFLRQFCDAHTCSGSIKPFLRGGRKRTSIFYLAISILILMLLPIFYLIVFLYQRCHIHHFSLISYLSLPCLLNNTAGFDLMLQRDEKGYTGTEANLKTESKEKAVLIGEAHGIIWHNSSYEHGLPFSNLLIHSFQVLHPSVSSSNS